MTRCEDEKKEMKKGRKERIEKKEKACQRGTTFRRMCRTPSSSRSTFSLHSLFLLSVWCRIRIKDTELKRELPKKGSLTNLLFQFILINGSNLCVCPREGLLLYNFSDDDLAVANLHKLVTVRKRSVKKFKKKRKGLVHKAHGSAKDARRCEQWAWMKNNVGHSCFFVELVWAPPCHTLRGFKFCDVHDRRNTRDKWANAIANAKRTLNSVSLLYLMSAILVVMRTYRNKIKCLSIKCFSSVGTIWSFRSFYYNPYMLYWMVKATSSSWHRHQSESI